jgi:sec-independent protein translocase protein TatA
MLNAFSNSFAILGIGSQEAIWIVVLVLVLFGGKKIPEFFRGVGRGVGELQKGLAESKASMTKALDDHEKDEKKDA